MAETLGVVASGVAIAQLAAFAGGAVVKLKQLWDDVRDVPENIDLLMQQLDCLDPALWEFEQTVGQRDLPPEIWNDMAARRSAEFCRKALGKLEDLAVDLSTQINSSRRSHRKLACAKAILKKDQLKRLEKQLETAVGMLQLAQQGYIIALVKAQADIIASRLTTQLSNARCLLASAVSNTRSDEHQLEGTTYTIASISQRQVTVRTHSSQRTKSNLRWKGSSTTGSFGFERNSRSFWGGFRPPWWLRGVLYALELRVGMSYGGWKFSLRGYSMRPSDSPVFRAAVSGDAETLQAMFQAGEASPYDCDEFGTSLLMFSLGSGRAAVLKLFIELNIEIDGSETNDVGWTIADFISDPFQSEMTAKDRLEGIELLICHDLMPGGGVMDIRTDCWCPRLTRSWEAFRRLQPFVCPLHRDTSLLSRLRRSAQCFIDNPEALRFILNPEWSLDPERVCNLEGDGCSLIHTVSERIPRLNYLLKLRQGENYIDDWRIFIRDVIQKTKDLHILEWRGYDHSDVYNTPLLRLIRLPFYLHPSPRDQHRIRSWFFTWLEMLKEAGVDLIQYGSRENEVLRTTKPHAPQCRRESLGLIPRFRRTRVIGFKYGPEVEDWDIWWDEPTDVLVGEFWKLIEHPPLHVAGEWCESESDSSADECFY